MNYYLAATQLTLNKSIDLFGKIVIVSSCFQPEMKEVTAMQMVGLITVQLHHLLRLRIASPWERLRVTALNSLDHMEVHGLMIFQ